MGSTDMRTQAVMCRLTVISVFMFSLLLAVSALGCGGGEEGEEKASELSIEELWARAQEADAAIESWHMEVSSYYENTQYGSGQIQSLIIDVDGEDLHEQDLFLGQVYFEYIRAGDRQYVKDMESGIWSEAPAEQSSTDTSEYTSQFLELPSIAVTQEHVGTETMEETEAERFRFTLSSDGVKDMFSAQPSFDLSENTGGEVDVWIDSDEYYMVRYELVIRNAIIPEKIGHGDIRFVVSIRDINQSIEITPPV
jgi:hypothetical protein